MLNNKSDYFEVKLSLEVNGVDYIIHRTGNLKVRTKRATGEVRNLCPVSVKFYVEENGELIDLSGAARSNSQYGSGTNEEIRKILGTFDDFILTSLSLQNNGQNFVDKKQAERKKILSQFMGIDLFDKLFDIAKHDVADERAYLRKVKDKDVFGQLSKLQKELQGYEEQKEKLDKEVEPFEVEINELEEQIETLKSKLKYVPTGVNTVDTLDEVKKEGELERQKQVLKSEEEYREAVSYTHLTLPTSDLV